MSGSFTSGSDADDVDDPARPWFKQSLSGSFTRGPDDVEKNPTSNVEMHEIATGS